ncbi:MAG: hypothetical protein ACJA0Z_002342, partial [Halioglobus sp.]
VSEVCNKNGERALIIKSEILKEYAGEQINCCARHYYLKYSKELNPTGL